MRYLIFYFIMGITLFATDYSNMFITNELINPYSELEDEDPKVKQKKEEGIKALKERKEKALAKKDDVYYQAQFGFESESGYDKKGYGINLSVIKPLPNFSLKHKGTFVQGDFLYTVKRLATSTGVNKDYINFTAYGGYAFEFNERTTITARAGASYVAAEGNIEFAYAMGVKRALASEKYRLVAGWLIVGNLTLLSLGLEFSF